MAFLRKAGNLAGLLLDRRLRQQEFDRQLGAKTSADQATALYEQLIKAQAAQQQAELERTTGMLGRLNQDPAFAQRLEGAGVDDVDGYDISAFLPTETQKSAPVSKRIAEATQPEQLPTDQGLLNERISQGRIGGRLDFYSPDQQPDTQGLADVARLFTERDEKLGQLRSEKELADEAKTAQAAKQAYDTDMLKGQAAAQTWDASGRRINREENQDESNIRVGEASRMNPILASRAGAETSARLEAEWLNPAITQAKLNQAKQEAILKAATARDTEQAAFINDAANTITSITPDWERLQQLSKAVNVMPGRQVLTSTISAPLQLNKDAAEMDQIAANMAKRLANDPRFGGNKGAQSEKDSEAILGRLPNSSDSAESAQRKIAAWNKNMYQGLQAISTLPPGAGPAQRINAFRQQMGLPPIDLQQGTVRSSILDQFDTPMVP